MATNLKTQLEHFKMTSRKETIEAAKALADGSAEALQAVIEKVSNSKIVASIGSTIRAGSAKADELKRYITSSVPPKFVPMLTEIYVLGVGVGLLLTGVLLLKVLGALLVLWAVCNLLPTIIEVAQEKIMGLMKSSL